MDGDGERDYQRRRADEGTERRIDRLSIKVDKLDEKVDALSIRVAAVAAVLGLITLVANIIGPIVAARILGLPA